LDGPQATKLDQLSWWSKNPQANSAIRMLYYCQKNKKKLGHVFLGFFKTVQNAVIKKL
jgi:hypothetical protein